MEVSTSISVEEEFLAISVASECLLSVASYTDLMDRQSELSAATTSSSICVETYHGSVPECVGKEVKRRTRGMWINIICVANNTPLCRGGVNSLTMSVDNFS